MRNIVFAIILGISTTSFAMPSAFTELFTAGMWAGEATYFNNGEETKFFYAAEISADGKTFNTITPPGADPETRFQRYTLKNNGLYYSLKFNRLVIEGILPNFAKNDSNTVWEFIDDETIQRYTWQSDSQILIEAYRGGKKHAEIHLTYQGSGNQGMMWVGIAQVQYHLSNINVP